ncbi:hypothetical protein FA13DRAFT_1633427 [Coprinellus micaceus]|uniref:Uncharacterized protein n=1 Tax=Coprinellus micaceus TaxID=71717 RepID=A0A4Y7T3C9_COPMI|nr:hypothetical protein FA13DRAFT_1633427 [Coprinellus micaceus]
MEFTPFTSGRFQFVDGQRFYSPNSIVDPPLLLNPLEEGLQNIFLPHRRGKDRVRYREYVHPRPWNPKYAWVPFVPVNPYQWFDNCSYMGRVLSKYPPIEHFADESGKHHGWAIPPENEWAKLETELYKTIRTLSAKYNIPCPLPFLPHAIGYQGMYAHKRSLMTRLDTAREWFFVFFGALSYLIAMLRLTPNHSGVGSEEWLPAILSAGVSPTFVDGIHNSLVHELNQDQVRRSGVIIDLLKPLKGQPDPNWFITMGVPVWYRWGSGEESQSLLKKWRPPEVLPSQQSSTAPPSSSSKAPVRSTDATTTAKKDPEWVEFFAARERAHQKVLKTESSQARQVRENRTREPATASAKVFEWFESEKDGVLWERVPVLAKARLDTLDGYGDGQKRYDPFFNEWDCCSEWGDDNYEDWSDDGYIHAPPIPASTATLVCTNKQRPSVPVSQIKGDLPTDIFLDLEAAPRDDLLHESDEALKNFLGFTHPVLGLESPASSPSEREKIFYLRIIGLDLNKWPIDHAYFSSGHFSAAQAFIKSLSSRQIPSPGTWDLREDCVRPVALTPRARNMGLVTLQEADKVDPHDSVKKYYIFTETTKHSWRLAVTSASAVFMICRRPAREDITDIGLLLSSHGIPFRAFFPESVVMKGPENAHIVSHSIPKRPFGHKFTGEDYDAYVHMRTLLLGQSHMQAAIKRGGIIWRLAVGTLGTSRASLPPSFWGATHRFELDGVQYVDSALTTMEMDLICGAYECVSADSKQRALKSWWPLARYYEKEECGENYGRWTERREDWYTKRLAAIESGCGVQPLNYTEWKSSQHGPTPIRTLHAYTERTSYQVFESHCLNSRDSEGPS